MQTSLRDSPAEVRNLLVLARCTRQRQWDSVGKRIANELIFPVFYGRAIRWAATTLPHSL